MLIPSATFTDYIVGNSVVADSGKYYCLVNNGCKTVKSTETHVTILPTNSKGCEVNGIEGIDDDAKLPDVTIYPNPANDHFYFRLNKLSNYHITTMIRNLIGQQVFVETFTSDKNPNIKVDISGLKAGVYLFSVVDSNNKLIGCEKLVVY